MTNFDSEMLKQVIVVNEALKLPKGKLAAQVAHASVAAFLEATETVQQSWLAEGMPKIVLKIEDEAALLELRAEAERRGLPLRLVEDAGHTVVAAGTVTCLGLGPAEATTIDAVTGALRLLR